MEYYCEQKLQELDHLFRKAVRKFVKERDKIFIEGISLPALMILRKIFIFGEQRLSDLADDLDLSSGAITAQCDKLEKHGLAERHRYKDDRRTIYLRISAQGQEFVKRHSNIGPIHANILFQGFDESELELMHSICIRVIQNLDGLCEKITKVAKQNERGEAQQTEETEDQIMRAELMRDQQQYRQQELKKKLNSNNSWLSY